MISVGLALGVRVGIQKLGSLGLFPFPPSPPSPLLLPLVPVAVAALLEEGGMWVVPASSPAMLLILGAKGTCTCVHNYEVYIYMCVYTTEGKF